MKIILILSLFFLSASTEAEDEFLEMDEYTKLDINNQLPDEAIHPEIADGYEEADAKTAKTTNPTIYEPTVYNPTTPWDTWIEGHLTETILWSIIGLLLIFLVGLSCCLFDISHLLFNLLRAEAEVQQFAPVQLFQV